MLLPFIAWAITGLFFFIKPGYSDAYQSLPIKTYPIKSQINLPVKESMQWLAVKQLRSVLGDHLLVKTTSGWKQLSTLSFSEISTPSDEQIKALVGDAIASNIKRYGQIATIEKSQVTTTSDVRISLNWQEMTLRQQGKDTDFINMVYDIHYLRWTGIKSVDEVLGVVGLFLVVVLAFLGTIMTVKPRKRIT